jgi:hypothetical protein
MVEGYRVDPINELFVWRHGEREQWYEPIQEFTHEELRVALVEEGGYDDRTIARYEKNADGPASYSIVHQRWLDDGNESPSIPATTWWTGALARTAVLCADSGKTAIVR